MILTIKKYVCVVSLLIMPHPSYKNIMLSGVKLSKLLPKAQPFTTQSLLLATLEKKHFENIMRKWENAGNQHFPVFPQCFVPFQTNFKF